MDIERGAQEGEVLPRVGIDRKLPVQLPRYVGWRKNPTQCRYGPGSRRERSRESDGLQGGRHAMSTDVEQAKPNVIIVDDEHVEAIAREWLTRFERPCEMHPADARQGLREQRFLDRRCRVQVTSDSAVGVAQLMFVASTLGDVSDSGDDQLSRVRLDGTEADVERYFDPVLPNAACAIRC